MNSKNRFLRPTLVGVLLSGLSIAVACGIEDGGIVDVPQESGVPDTSVIADASGDGGPADVIQPDTSPPPSCADASACLPAFDGGWSP